MTIRRATSADAALLAKLCETVQRLHYAARPDVFKPYSGDDALAACFRVMLESSENHIFIAEASDKAVGYVLAKVTHRPDNPFTYAFDCVFIDQFCVIDGEQGKGYGSRLLDAVCELARAENIRDIQLGVWNFNEQAVEFYQKRGFSYYHQRLELRL